APGGKLKLDFSQSVFDATGVPFNNANVSSGQIFVFSGSIRAAVSVTADVTAHPNLVSAADSGKVSVASTTGLLEGQIGLLESDKNLFTGTPIRCGEVLTIDRIVGSDVFMRDHVALNYEVSNNARFSVIDPISVSGDIGLI